MTLALRWYRRPDGLLNADCACGATLCGYEPEPDPIMVQLGLQHTQEEGERWHFQRTEEDRKAGHKYAPCGPVEPGSRWVTP